MNSSAAQMIGQLTPRPVEPGFHSSNRPADHLADFIVGKILLVKEGEDEAILRAELGEGAFQLTGQVVRVGQSGPTVGQVVTRLNRHGTTSAPGQGGPTSIGGDPQKPGTQWSFDRKTRDPAQGAKEGLLQHVFGVLAMSQHSEAEAENRSLIPVDQQAWRLRIAGLECFDQREVAHQNMPSAQMRGNPVRLRCHRC